MTNGASVTLIGGALASNIFWQIAGKVTIEPTAAMNGMILCQTFGGRTLCFDEEVSIDKACIRINEKKL